MIADKIKGMEISPSREELETSPLLEDPKKDMTISIRYGDLIPSLKTIVRLSVPLIAPSVNDMYQHRRGGGVYLSTPGRIYKAKVIEEIRKQKVEKVNTAVVIMLHFCFSDYRKRDVDNYIKGTLDAINGILIIDDSYVRTVCATKEIRTGIVPFTEIIIVPMLPV